jgi:hypothetical protein
MLYIGCEGKMALVKFRLHGEWRLEYCRILEVRTFRVKMNLWTTGETWDIGKCVIRSIDIVDEDKIVEEEEYHGMSPGEFYATIHDTDSELNCPKCGALLSSHEGGKCPE